MFRILILLMCVFTCRAADAQQVAMRIFNGSFEEWEANSGFAPNVINAYWPPADDSIFHWFGQGYMLSLQDGYCFDNGINKDSPDTSVKPANGRFFLIMNAHTNTFLIYPFPVFPNYAIGGLGQKPLCGFRKGVKYKISFKASCDSVRFFEQIINTNCNIIIDTIKKPSLSVWLGDESVGVNFNNWFNNPGNNYQVLLDEYNVSFRAWEAIDFEFIPDRDYEYIYFHPILKEITPAIGSSASLKFFMLLLDDVSDIYYAEPTFVLPPQDTVTAGNCYSVEPYNIHPNEAEHRWEVLGSDSIFYVGAEPELCPTQTTTYVVYSHDDCGWAEIDTLTLVVLPKKEEPPLPAQPESSLVLYPNPGSASGQIQIRSSHAGIFRLFDASGRLIGQYSLQAGEQTLNAQLASGIYFYQATLSDQSRKRGKYLVGRK